MVGIQNLLGFGFGFWCIDPNPTPNPKNLKTQNPIKPQEKIKKTQIFWVFKFKKCIKLKIYNLKFFKTNFETSTVVILAKIFGKKIFRNFFKNILFLIYRWSYRISFYFGPIPFGLIFYRFLWQKMLFWSKFPTSETPWISLQKACLALQNLQKYVSQTQNSNWL